MRKLIACLGTAALIWFGLSACGVDRDCQAAVDPNWSFAAEHGSTSPLAKDAPAPRADDDECEDED